MPAVGGNHALVSLGGIVDDGENVRDIGICARPDHFELAICAVGVHFGNKRTGIALQAECHVVAQFGNGQQAPRVF